MSASLNRRSFLTASAAVLGSALASRRGSALSRPREPREVSRGGSRAWVPSEELIQRLPEIMRLAVVPAVSIGIVEAGEVTFARSFGVKVSGSDELADADTVFEAASLSKPMVACVAMMLGDEGALDIERPLVDFVSPTHLLDDPRARGITARHVMSQSSGLRNWRRPTDTEFPLSFDPGAQYQYSGEGFVWLARVLEEITGTGFVRLMRERLVDPLGLRGTTFLWDPSFAGRMATGHNQDGRPTEGGLHLKMAEAHLMAAEKQGRSVEDWRWDDLVAAAREANPTREPMPGGLVPNAAASLLTTGSEYALFTAQLLDPPSPGPSLLEAESRALMQTPHTVVEPPVAWGLGVALEEWEGRRYVWHWGNNGDFRSYVLGEIAERRAIAVFTNAAGGPKVYQRIVQDVVGFDPASLIWS